MNGQILTRLSGRILPVDIAVAQRCAKPVDSPQLTSEEPDISGWPIEAIMPAIDAACWCFRQFLLIHAIE
jgi:hypothetical protein